VHRLHLPTLTWRGPLPLHPASAPVQSGGGFTAQGLVSATTVDEAPLIIGADCFVCIDLLHRPAIEAPRPSMQWLLYDQSGAIREYFTLLCRSCLGALQSRGPVLALWHATTCSCWGPLPSSVSSCRRGPSPLSPWGQRSSRQQHQQVPALLPDSQLLSSGSLGSPSQRRLMGADLQHTS
jgi:hypothetical protein